MSYGFAVQMLVVPTLMDISAGTVEWDVIMPSTGARKFTVVDCQLVPIQAVAIDSGVLLLRHTPSGGTITTKLTFTLDKVYATGTMIKADTPLDATTEFDVNAGDTLRFYSSATGGVGTVYCILYIRELP